MKLSFLYRLWYYFRQGYGIYLTFIMGFISTIVTVFYLAITHIPELAVWFPNLWIFSLLVISVGVPLAIGLGWYHMKGSGLWGSETDINNESNPYNYRVPPGYWQEVFVPLFIELLVMCEGQVKNTTDYKRLEDLKAKLQVLEKGESVGKPIRKV